MGKTITKTMKKIREITPNTTCIATKARKINKVPLKSILVEWKNKDHDM